MSIQVHSPGNEKCLYFTNTEQQILLCTNTSSFKSLHVHCVSNTNSVLPDELIEVSLGKEKI